MLKQEHVGIGFRSMVVVCAFPIFAQASKIIAWPLSLSDLYGWFSNGAGDCLSRNTQTNKKKIGAQNRAESLQTNKQTVNLINTFNFAVQAS